MAWWHDYWLGAMGAYVANAPKWRTPALGEYVRGLKLSSAG